MIYIRYKYYTLTFVLMSFHSMNSRGREVLCIPQLEGQSLHNIDIAERLDKQDTKIGLSLFVSVRLLPSGPRTTYLKVLYMRYEEL